MRRPFEPGVWTLFDVLKLLAARFLTLGEAMQEAISNLSFDEADPEGADKAQTELEVRRHLKRLWKLCGEMQMPISVELLEQGDGNPPQSARELELIRAAIFAEIKSKALFFMPDHRAAFYEKADLLSDEARDAFPSASAELREAANSFACDLNTASVMHAMRAAEIGARAMAAELGCEFPSGIEHQDLHPILEQCESKIKAMKDRPRGPEKAADQEFYSTAASNFRYFKDGYRVRSAHARATFTETEARSILQHTLEFFEVIAKRFTEASAAI